MRFKQSVIGLLVATGVGLHVQAQAAERQQSQDNPDKRLYLNLLPAERDLVLQEMRNFLHVIQQMHEALAQDDMTTVAKAARTMGSNAANEIPPHVVAKLPEDFKQFAGQVHMAFDTIALDAESLGDAKHTMGQLGTMLNTCAACHAVYQIPTHLANAPDKANVKVKR